MKRRSLAALVGACALLAALLPQTSALAATTYEIQVGAEAGPAFSWRFYPSSVKVHKGDSIHFSSLVDLTGDGMSAEEFRESKMSAPDGEYALWLNDPDENSQKVNTNVFWEFVGPPCGSAETPCEYKGDEIHTGLPFISDDPGFHVLINANPGTVFYAVNLFGGTSQMRIEVVAPNEAASDPAALQAQAADMLARDTSLAHGLNASLNKPAKHKEGGKTYWDAYAGYDTRYLSFFTLFPKKIKAKKGDRVRWHFEFNNELHSATYNKELAFEVFEESFLPMCDPDGDGGSEPDLPGSEEPPFCPDGTTLEVDLHQKLFRPVGNGKLTSKKDVESSGVQTPTDLGLGGFGQGDYWDVKLDAKSGKKGFLFYCLFHGFGMKNKVFVR